MSIVVMGRADHDQRQEKHMQRARRALVIGGGIAGPVCAVWLRRIGIEVDLYEQRGASAAGEGAFLGLAPNGMAVLAALELDREIARLGHPCSAFTFLNRAGAPIGHIDRAADATRFGAALTMLRRGELNAALLDAARRAGVNVHAQQRLRSLRSDERAIVATFEGGAEAQADFAVGCDGQRSTTRALAFPGAAEPRFTGLYDYGGFARGVELPAAPGVNLMLFGERAFFGAFGTSMGEVWWFHNGPRSAPEAASQALLELHSGDPRWVADLVRATPRVLGPWPLSDLPALPRYSAGRICLIGDAAHAMPPSAGQGASLALEDAMVLAMCLRDLGAPEPAFQRFERLRRPRVEAIARIARRNGSPKSMPSRPALWLRDRLLPFFLRLGAAEQDRGYAFKVRWDERVGAAL
jgi:2-polyprenyl-6-methoxyphenol hydroxylase-like FAD-dependent oxidoreductase